MYPEKTLTQKDTCTAKFIAALHTLSKTWKQPKYPSTEEWIKKMWYIYTMECYSSIKRKEITAFVPASMDLEITMLSEVSQSNIKCYHLYVDSKRRTQWTPLQNRYSVTDVEKLTVSKLDRLWVGGCTEGLGWKCCKIWLWWLLYTYKCNKIH